MLMSFRVDGLAAAYCRRRARRRKEATSPGSIDNFNSVSISLSCPAPAVVACARNKKAAATHSDLIADLQSAIEAQRGQRTHRPGQQVEADIGQSEMRG